MKHAVMNLHLYFLVDFSDNLVNLHLLFEELLIRLLFLILIFLKLLLQKVLIPHHLLVPLLLLLLQLLGFLLELVVHLLGQFGLLALQRKDLQDLLLSS